MRVPQPNFHILLFFTFLLQTGLHAQDLLWHRDSISCGAFQRDVEILIEQLKFHHGGLYRYADSVTFEAAAQAYTPCAGPISYGEAYYRIAELINVIRDGHTWVMPSEEQALRILEQERFLPFTVAVSGTLLHVEENFSDCHALTPGTQLTSIDGFDIRSIVKSLLPYFTADGHSLAGKLGGLESQFWWYYSLHFGFRELHRIGYVDASGREAVTNVTAMSATDRVTHINEVYLRGDNAIAPVSWRVEGESGVLKVSSFGAYNLRRYRRLFNEALADFHRAGVSQLVIDVRDNGGGREGVENLLYACTGQQCQEKYDEVTISSPIASDYRYINDGWKRKLEDLLYRAVEFRKDDDGQWHRRARYQRSFRLPDHPFLGPVCVLINRNTFSGAAEFAALVRDNVPNSVLIGEETCGGYQGHTSGYAYEITLPSTGFLVTIPRVWFDLNVPGTHEGGVLPHIHMSRNVGTTDDDLLDFALTGGWLSPMMLTQNETERVRVKVQSER